MSSNCRGQLVASEFVEEDVKKEKESLAEEAPRD